MNSADAEAHREAVAASALPAIWQEIAVGNRSRLPDSVRHLFEGVSEWYKLDPKLYPFRYREAFVPLLESNYEYWEGAIVGQSTIFVSLSIERSFEDFTPIALSYQGFVATQVVRMWESEIPSEDVKVTAELMGFSRTAELESVYEQLLEEYTTTQQTSSERWIAEIDIRG